MKTKIKLISILILTLFFFAACTNTRKDNDVIKIGAILPLTGSLSVMGEVEKNAMILALDEVNKNSKKIEILFEDGMGNPKDAVAAANKLININNVDILITSTTGASLAVEPVATENKKNLIAFCMDQDISEKSPYVMRYYIGINEEAKAINNYFKENMQNTSRVGVIYAKVPSIEKVVKDNYVPFLESMNKIVPLQESYKIGESDFKTTVLKIRKSNIDHLIILGYGFEYPNIFNELNHSNILRDIKILGGWGFLYTQVNPNLLEGVMVSGPDYVFKNQKLAGKFYQKYFNTYDSYPNFDAAFAYNVVTSIAENLKKEDFSSPIKEKFISNNNLDGVVGKYNFSKEGNMIVSTGLGVYKNGTIVFVEK